MNTINTPKGEIRLLQPTAELLKNVRSLLPFGLLRYNSPEDGTDYSIVVECGDKELSGIKLQSMPSDKETAKLQFCANRILIAHSIAGYLHNGFAGLLIPCAYGCARGGDKYESGIAYLGAPSPCGPERLNFPFEESGDELFGHGFMKMVFSHIDAFLQSSEATEIPVMNALGFEVSPHSCLGSLDFSFMLVGPHVVCLQNQISEEDPVWEVMKETGISEVFHLPSGLASIPETDLHIAKPAD